MPAQDSNLLQYSREAAPRNIAGKLAVGFIIAAIPLAADVFFTSYDKRPWIFLAAVFCTVMAVFSGISSTRLKRPDYRRFAWVVIPIALLELVSLFTIVLASEPLGRPRDYSPRLKCASDMREILLAALMYANEHNGQFPPSLDVLLATEDITSDIFVCPSSSLTSAPGATAADQAASMRADPAHYLSYIYLGRGLTNDASTPLQIILYEPLTDHGGAGINIGYSDGSVAWLDRKQAITAINAGVSAAATRPTTRQFIRTNNQGGHP